MDSTQIHQDRPPRRALAALLATSLLVVPAAATTVDRLTAAERMAQAELVFEGVVLAVEHRNADVRSDGELPLPHTFVTFSVEHALKGSAADGDTITLRFLGGPDGSGLTLGVAGVPRFENGDRSILFVRDNGRAICPLVGWDRGRLRIVRGQVYDDHGKEVWLSPGGDLVPGMDAIDVSRAPYYPAAAEEAEAPSPPAASVRPDAEALREILRAMRVMVAATDTPAPPVESVRLAEPFSFRAPRPSPAPKTR